ncbi:hypothetical protein SAMN06265337_0066 [Hymenobacter gelipurpurascens]|uniref:Uncharacterized protein n=1 Tax=Hymenobacter gelipurpurascens TaxID=89968 RepID=A0A212T0C9_9BACT|nr:hypothetical protein [Hymenobacter gelipurpurascens]SNC59502.1 hypothetical protein SAMN06265337_0066 [Hymenobacter gelipurpurascens]
MRNKKNNTKTWVGASLAVLAAGTALTYSRKLWPFAAKASQNDSGAANSNTRKGGKPGAAAKVDVALTNEVAEATQSSPKTEQNFTDEGATGNND